MKQFFRKNIYIIVPLYLVFSLILVCSLVKTNYEITSPGQINQVQNVISIENPYESKGTFNTTSVYVNEKCTLLQYFLSFFSKTVIVEPVSEIVDGTSIRNSQSGTIQKNNSINNSIICAYSKANFDIEYKYVGVIVHTLAIDATSDLQVGDIISAVAGKEFASMDEFYSLYNAARRSELFFDVKTGVCNLPLTVNGQEKIVSTDIIDYSSNGTPYPVFGFYIYDQYEIIDNSTGPKYTIEKTNTGGPSGGLMQTLAVYDSLTPGDLTNGLTIAGTGTINVDGSVGAIGGMYSKIFTAYYSGCDIFFVPFYESEYGETNYEEALRAYEVLGCPEDFIIVPVSTFNEAVDYLEKLGDTNA